MDTSDDRIRTVAIDEEGIEPPPPAPSQRRMRPAVALGAIGAAIAVLILFAVVSGPTDDDPQALAGDQQNTPSPSVVRTEPDTSQLLLVTASTEDGWEIEWEPQTGNADNPAFGIVLPRAERNQRGPQVDASRTYASRLDCGDPCMIDIGPVDDRQTNLVSVEGESAAWHATAPESIVWSRSTPDGVVVTAALVDDDGLDFAQEIPDLDLPSGDIVRWYDVHGFVTAGSEVRAYDTQGNVLWVSLGRLVDITTRTAMIVEDPGLWRIVDRITGSTIAIGSQDTNDVFVDIGEATPILNTTAGASWAYQFSVTDGGTSAGSVRLPLSPGSDSELRMSRDATGTIYTLSFVFEDS